MDDLDRKLLNLLQSSFPLTEQPFRDIGLQLAVSEREVIARVSVLKETNVIRQIGAIFDTRRLGYKTVLIAMRFPPEALDAAAQIVNQHPGVSHNYARNGPYNLWFTVAVPPNVSLEDTVQDMADRTGAEVFRMMPTVRFFKIGVNLDVVNKKGAAKDYYSPDGFKDEPDGWKRVEKLTDFEIKAVRELQDDLQLAPRPFTPMAKRLGITLPALFGLASEFQNRGVMRRFSAVLHHRKAGFKANAMAVWRVPPERSVEVGNTMAQSPWVSHCYERPTFPDWKYTHFSMIHAPSRDKCEEVVRDISKATGITDYMLLYSSREYKKTRVKYFENEETPSANAR